jgi:hypothetical protein
MWSRNYSIVTTMVNSGFRISEVLGLKINYEIMSSIENLN